MNHPTSIQPKLIAVALKSVNYAVDYTRIKNQYDEATFNTAWTLLSGGDRVRINEIVTTQKKPTPEELAALIVETSNREQLQTLRDDFGEELTVAAWGLLDEIARQRIVKLCEATKPVKEQEPQAVPTETVVEPEPQAVPTETVTEQESETIPTKPVAEQEPPPAPVEPVAKPEPETVPTEPVAKPKPETVPAEPVAKQKPETAPTEAVKERGSKTLLELDEQLEQLDDLIEAVAGDITPELQQAFDDLLEQQEETRDLYLKKLDNYAALIQSRKHWAEIRKAEGDRLRSLAEADFKTVDFLTERLKRHLTHRDSKKIRTPRFNLTVATNGGKQPMGLNVTRAEELPERFRKVFYEPDKTALRQGLESNDPEALEVAYWKERNTHLRIR